MPSRGRKRRTDRAEQYESPEYLDAMARLRTNLRQLRAARGWTQEMAAHRCGMLFQTYQPIESGRVNVTVATLVRLAAGFEVDLRDLLAPLAKSGRAARG